MVRTVRPTSGKATSASSVRRHSWVNITVTSATTVATWRKAITRTSEERRARRPASTTMRDIRSAEWRA